MNRLWNRSSARNGSDPGRATLQPLLMLMGIGLAVLGCAPGPPGTETERRAAGADEALARARASADRLGQRLMAELGAQLERGGPAAAIDVCSRVAPAAAAELSRQGLRIRRTSRRFRNPANFPDEWERTMLQRLEESMARGGAPEEIQAVDEAEGELRYLRPIVVGEICLQCHGAADKLDPAVRREIAERYPEDRASGYSSGDLRGAFSVAVRLEAPGTG